MVAVAVGGGGGGGCGAGGVGGGRARGWAHLLPLATSVYASLTPVVSFFVSASLHGNIYVQIRCIRLNGRNYRPYIGSSEII